MRIVARLALDRLRSVSRRREDYIGEWLPEPLLTGPDLTADSALAEQESYPVLLEPDGPYYFACEYLSFVNGWQEGAVRSAHYTLARLDRELPNRAHTTAASIDTKGGT